jgi:hypothetical protein
VIEKAVMIGQFFPEEAQGGKYSLQSIASGDKAPLFSDTQGGQAETGGSDAGSRALVIDMDVAAVLDHASLGVALVPKEQEMSVFDLVEKLVVLGRQNREGHFAGGRAAGLRLGNRYWQYFCDGQA